MVVTRNASAGGSMSPEEQVFLSGLSLRNPRIKPADRKSYFDELRANADMREKHYHWLTSIRVDAFSEDARNTLAAFLCENRERIGPETTRILDEFAGDATPSGERSQIAPPLVDALGVLYEEDLKGLDLKGVLKTAEELG